LWLYNFIYGEYSSRETWPLFLVHSALLWSLIFILSFTFFLYLMGWCWVMRLLNEVIDCNVVELLHHRNVFRLILTRILLRHRLLWCKLHSVWVIKPCLLTLMNLFIICLIFLELIVIVVLLIVWHHLLLRHHLLLGHEPHRWLHKLLVLLRVVVRNLHEWHVSPVERRLLRGHLLLIQVEQ
jgi:hypothetical protein